MLAGQRAVLLPGVGWLVASSSATNAILVRPPPTLPMRAFNYGVGCGAVLGCCPNRQAQTIEAKDLPRRE